MYDVRVLNAPADGEKIASLLARQDARETDGRKIVHTIDRDIGIRTICLSRSLADRVGEKLKVTDADACAGVHGERAVSALIIADELCGLAERAKPKEIVEAALLSNRTLSAKTKVRRVDSDVSFVEGERCDIVARRAVQRFHWSRCPHLPWRTHERRLR